MILFELAMNFRLARGVGGPTIDFGAQPREMLTDCRALRGIAFESLCDLEEADGVFEAAEIFGGCREIDCNAETIGARDSVGNRRIVGLRRFRRGVWLVR